MEQSSVTTVENNGNYATATTTRKKLCNSFVPARLMMSVLKSSGLDRGMSWRRRERKKKSKRKLRSMSLSNSITSSRTTLPKLIRFRKNE